MARMTNDYRAVGVAYAVALGVALLVGSSVATSHPLWIALHADVAATVAIFAFSVLYRNSSFYDAYWSVAPIVIAAYWIAIGSDGALGRQLLVALCVLAWGLRLTWNWARGWGGLGHEDWRYGMIAERTGRAYWLVSFAGIHLLPTLWVFGGCLPLYPALAVGGRPLSWLDGLALAVTVASIAVEAGADEQLRNYRRAAPAPDDFLRTGLWGWCRHPNYLGEMGFWWGLFLFGVAAAPDWWWTGVGALSITLMFRLVSLPMIERRMSERRPGFADWAARTSLVIPRRPPKEA
jgi:steroid 5-alpha reductase family enzyme